jgi:uncharacterized protein
VAGVRTRKRIRQACKAAGWACLAAVSIARADFYQGMEAYKHSDFERALGEFRPLAEMGDPRSEFMLGRLYYEGKGLTQNAALAYGWIKLAADAGLVQAVEAEKKLHDTLSPEDRASAQRLLADYSPEEINHHLMPKIIPNCEFQNQTRPQLLPQSVRRASIGAYPYEALRNRTEGHVTVEITIAADGSTREIRIIDAIPVGVFEDAARRVARATRFQPASHDGEPVTAITTLTVMFQLASIASSQYTAADSYVEKLHKRAGDGDLGAAYAYATIINGLPHFHRPWSESLPWIEKAARGGIKEAQFQLGQSLWIGRGCEVDRDKALDWLKRAAAQGSSNAQVSLARIFTHGGDAEPSKPLFWLERAAMANDASGKKYLAAFLAATPHESLRDPQRALVLVKELARGDQDDPVLVEIRAAAHAALGEFSAAVADEQAAMRAAKSLQWNTTDMAARLSAYQSSQSWFGELIPM